MDKFIAATRGAVSAPQIEMTTETNVRTETNHTSLKPGYDKSRANESHGSSYTEYDSSQTDTKLPSEEAEKRGSEIV
jgi:hypothetical protein